MKMLQLQHAEGVDHTYDANDHDHEIVFPALKQDLAMANKSKFMI